MKIFLAPPELDDLLEAVESFRDKPFTSDPYLDFHAQAFKAQWNNQRRYAEAVEHAPVADDEVAEKLKAGFALVDEASVRVDDTLSGELFDEFCELLGKHDTLDEESVAALIVLRKEGRLEPAGLIRNLLGQNSAYFLELAEETSVDVSLLAILAERLAKPVLADNCRAFGGEIKVIGHERNLCPCCANEPNMAMVAEEEGRRIVKCSLCHARWEFSRLACPFCCTQDHEKLKFLYYDLEEPHRVYVCNSCKRYIKAVDARKCQNRKVVMEVEFLATEHLDGMAAKKGYLRGETEIP